METSVFQTSCQMVLAALLIWDIQGKGEIQPKLEKLYSQQKQDRELTVAQIMNFLLQNSDLH